MARKLAYALAAIIAAGGAALWMLTEPQKVDEPMLASLQPGDAAKGEQVFWAGGCASCHAAPGASGDARKVLAGGHALVSDFGTFVAPNISPSAQGIGNWTLQDFANAMLKGVGRQGEHLYPSFPYTSYAKMNPQDVADLFAYMKTLPQSDNVADAHDLGFPFTLRRGLGLWKMLFLSDKPVVDVADASDQVKRGQYLSEALGHCGECHTPRNVIGGLETDQWMAGALSPETGSDGRKGIVPNITSGEGGIGDWSEGDIAYGLESGFTPDFDSLGGSMTDVVANMAQLTSEDREAIAAYLKAIPAHANGYPASR
ncbi:cytochrome C [Falsochrobactrum shanghaiense]|uniref:Cytochrome C n=1 Tax=Falsochrobactrum shanghaiense TaxID=2201899 RepID=A0A316JIH3_9HYPH|nr:cytochrome c [Falsochrobactrum shanghaiense]PWL19053.1 cytochrome C [Falsochrobactrum shanghaiense]